MSQEYVKFSNQEVNYGKKNLFKSQINILNLTKNFTKYREIRKEDLMLKIALKTKIEEAKQTLKSFESMLPKPKMENVTLKELEKVDKEKKKFRSIQEEIDLIKKKIELLN